MSVDLPEGLTDEQFIGWVVHIPASDEFLMHHEFTDQGKKILWHKQPGHAKTMSEKKARAIAKKCGKDAKACPLFNLGDQWVVGEEFDD